jgi:hypothetical protein
MKMSSPRCLVVLRHGTLLSAALAFSFIPASAQFANPINHSTAVSTTGESSSDTLQLTNDERFTEASPLPGAPGVGSSGGGQYDNKGGGRGNLISHLAFEIGGGANAPTNDSSPYITWGGNITLGGGYRLSRMLSLMAEYQFIDSKLPGAIIAEAGANGGNDHIWSLTLDPVVDLIPRGKVDVYVTGGGGFYRKLTSFTDPQLTEYCYYFCTIGTTNAVVGHFSSNQGGWSVGAGIAHRFGGFTGDGKMKVFAEARYLDVLSPAVIGATPNGLGATTVGADTKIIPVTFGVRW